MQSVLHACVLHWSTFEVVAVGLRLRVDDGPASDDMLRWLWRVEGENTIPEHQESLKSVKERGRYGKTKVFLGKNSLHA